ncbi:MAG: anti-anti-sigma factor [Pirellulaceae bacterium]|jgi:anti-anti-sigma factor
MQAVESKHVGDVLLSVITQPTLRDTPVIEQCQTDLDRACLEAAADKKMILSFRNVKFMSSEMIRVVVKLHSRCKRDKLDLRLCNIAPDIMQVFQITNLTKLLTIVSDETAAMKSFNKTSLLDKIWPFKK